MKRIKRILKIEFKKLEIKKNKEKKIEKVQKNILIFPKIFFFK